MLGYLCEHILFIQPSIHPSLPICWIPFTLSLSSHQSSLFLFVWFMPRMLAPAGARVLRLCWELDASLRVHVRPLEGSGPTIVTTESSSGFGFLPRTFSIPARKKETTWFDCTDDCNFHVPSRPSGPERGCAWRVTHALSGISLTEVGFLLSPTRCSLTVR